MTFRGAVVLLVAGAAFAQAPDPDWQRVGALKEGSAVQVHLRTRDVVAGPLVRWSAADLAVGQRTIARPEIAKVTRRSRLRGALIGFAVGFAIAAPIGAYAGPYIADWGNPSASVRLRHAAGWGLFFGGVGAGIGALVSAHPTVYRAR